jgi:hypothetical protein
MRLDFSIPGKGILGQGRRQAADCILILLEHRPVINQDFFFKLAQVFQLNRCGSPGQHVQDINASLGHTRQVVRLGRTPTTLVFTLCVGFNPSDFTKNFCDRPSRSLSCLKREPIPLIWTYDPVWHTSRGDTLISSLGKLERFELCPESVLLHKPRPDWNIQESQLRGRP